MFERAAGVLRRNDMGGWTRAAPPLYPHQWSWESAFIAIGLARLDGRRAASELTTLLDGQWTTGKIPHVVFNPNAPPGSYLLGPEHWASASLSENAVGTPRPTSALCQPAVHALAALRIWETVRGTGDEDTSAALSFLRRAYPRLLAWHRYLATSRDPEGSGLVTIYHPWESGTDNFPHWDGALAKVEVGEMPTYARPDLGFVDEPSERPTAEEYDRYLWLVELLKRARYDETLINDSHPFLVKDMLFSAILAAANEALPEIARLVGAPQKDREAIEGWIERGHGGLEACYDEDLGLYLDQDLRSGEPLRVRTVAGFAPLISGVAGSRRAALLKGLFSRSFAGHERLRWPLPPSTSPEEARFHARILAWTRIVGRMLAVLGLSSASGRRGGSRRTQNSFPGATRRRRLRGILRAVHRRAARFGRPVLDRRRRARLARRGCLTLGEAHESAPTGRPGRSEPLGVGGANLRSESLRART